MNDWAPLDRETIIRAVALALELLPTNPDRAEYLLDELLGRLVVDEAVAHKAEIADHYGIAITQQ